MQINLFLLHFAIFFILIVLSLLNISMFLTSAQQATAQTSTTTSLQSTHVLLTDRSTQTSQSYAGPRTVNSTIPYQLIKTSNKNIIWQNVALAPNTVPSNAIS